ncbi:MAG: HNH endonuclease [Gaiellaceae bacterium]
MQQVLVLNSSCEPLNVCTVHRAHVLVFKGRAEVIEEYAQPLRSASDTYARPHVIRLLNYVHVPRAVKKKISRRALFARDGWRCGYCGSSTSKLTLDHIVPRSRGGESVWENVVSSCASCNHRKGSRLLTEAKMALRISPRPPAPVVFIHLAAATIPPNWRPYLQGYGLSSAA